MENTTLKLDHIRLTPAIIETINYLQAGGTTHWQKSPDDDDFANEPIKDILDELTCLSDFITEVHVADVFTNKGEEFLKMQAFVLKMKKYMKSFMSPTKTKS